MLELEAWFSAPDKFLEFGIVINSMCLSYTFILSSTFQWSLRIPLRRVFCTSMDLVPLSKVMFPKFEWKFQIETIISTRQDNHANCQCHIFQGQGPRALSLNSTNHSNLYVSRKTIVAVYLQVALIFCFHLICHIPCAHLTCSFYHQPIISNVFGPNRVSECLLSSYIPHGPVGNYLG